MAIPQAFIQDLVARADVVEIVGRFVQLKKGGANYMGLCPFHGEKSPSFSVSPAKQFYHCFGCGKNGNAIGFLMEHLGLSFVEAVKDLAEQQGMVMPEEESTPQERAQAAQRREKQNDVTQVLERAAQAYSKQLKESPQAVAYLKGRGLSGEVAKAFGLGYALEGWRGLANVFPDYSDHLLVDSGLVIQNEEEAETKRYDRFRDRIMFPIRNVKGECIGFGGRVLGSGTPKYLNSPETAVFSKGRELYGLFEARHALRESGYVLVTEGYMDVVALAQWGFPHAVATLGTACTADHVQKLFRFTDAVVFSFDGDEAGRRAARKALEIVLPYATDVRSVKFLFLPAEHDPDSYIRELGREAFARQVHDAMPLSRFLIDVAREDCDLETAEGRAHMASKAQPLWMALPTGAFKQQMLGDICHAVQLGQHEVAQLWGVAPGARTTRSHNRVASKSKSQPQPFIQRGGRRGLPTARADHAARLLLSHAQAWGEISDEDHTALCELPAPHGPLFVWLEGQFHDFGAQPWAALREALRDNPNESFALQLMAKPDEHHQAEAVEAQEELRALLNRLLIERLKQLETQAIEASKTDPQALAQYRALQVRRRALEANDPS